jgi:hypothetical protein
MTLAIKAGSLLSRAKRKNITGGRPRRISTDLRFSDTSGGDGMFQRVWNPVSRFVGWLFSGAVRLVSVSVTTLFSWATNGVMAISRFNWNATDNQLKLLQAGNNVAMASIWGSVVGQGAGWLAGIAVGAGVAYLVPVIGGGALAKTVASAVGTEAMEELYFGLRGAITQTLRTLGTNTLITGYMNLRRLIKRIPEPLLIQFFGEERADFIKRQWGRSGGPSWTLAGALEDRIEAIDNDTLRAFIEAATEEAWDGFMEAGYIAAQEIDQAYAQAKRNEEINGLGKERGVLLTPDREAENETVYLEGPEKLVKQQTIQTLANHRLMFNRDVGQIVGTNARDYYRANPQRRKGSIVFRSVPGPPWREPNGERAREASYSIPDMKYGVRWADLKQWCRPYQWGEFRANANLDNGRQMAVYGATAQEAEQTLKRLLNLSTANLVTLSITQEKERNIKLKKHPTRMYPAFATLLFRTPSVDLTGRTDLSGDTWDERKERVPIWRDEEPDDIDWG